MLSAMTAREGGQGEVHGEVSFHAKNVAQRVRRTLAPYWPVLPG